MHAINWEFGFDSTVDVFKSMQNQTVECFIEAFENITGFFEELAESGF